MKKSEGDFFDYKLATKMKRFLAFLLDSAFTMVVVYFYKFFFHNKSFMVGDFDIFNITLSALISLLLGAVFYPFFSGNLGHRLLNIKVIDSTTGEDYTKFQDGGIREFLKNIMSNLFLPIVWLLFDKKNRNLYDRIVKTYVVERKKVNK